MNADDAPRPGSLPGCPRWCQKDHGEPLDPMHHHDCGMFTYGTGTLGVRVVWNPRDYLPAYREPRVAVAGWRPETAIERGGADFVWLVSGEAQQFAGLMDLLGDPELAQAIRRGAELLAQTDTEPEAPHHGRS